MQPESILSTTHPVTSMGMVCITEGLNCKKMKITYSWGKKKRKIYQLSQEGKKRRNQQSSAPPPHVLFISFSLPLAFLGHISMVLSPDLKCMVIF